MKIKNLIFAQIFVLVSFIMFSACTEKGLGLDEGQQPTRQKVSSNQGILAFSSFEEFKNTLKAVQNFTLDQRLAWEQEMGFTSFGTLANQVYESVSEMEFNSEDEFYSFVELNSDYLQIVEDENEDKEIEYSLLTKEYINSERWLMNENRMYIIDTLVYRFYDDNMAVVTKLDNVSALARFNSLEEVPKKEDYMVYSHIIYSSPNGSSYPEPFNNYNKQVVSLKNKEKDIMRIEFGAFTKTTWSGEPWSGLNINGEVRHYYVVNCYKARKIWFFTFYTPTTGEVNFMLKLKSGSLNPYADTATGWKICGKATNFYVGNTGEYYDILANGSIHYYDSPLFYKQNVHPNSPATWTSIVAWELEVIWGNRYQYPIYEVRYNNNYSSGYENTLTYY